MDATERSDVSLSDDVRRALGAFYTPDWVVNYMVNKIDPTTLNTGSILEPSGGDGAFVDGLLRAGVRTEQVTVWDINPGVQKPLESLGVNVEIGDSLARTDVAPRFDAVIGNPPYLNKQSEYIRSNKTWLQRRYAAIGANDTYSMFTYLAGDYLKPGGQIVFIVSNTFLTLGIHKKFREWMSKNFLIEEIVLMPTSTFPDAAVHTAIFTIRQGRPSKSSKTVFLDARQVSDGNIGNAKRYEVFQESFESLPGHIFSYDKGDQQLFNATSDLPRLVDYLDGGLGMHTGDNKRYLAVVMDGNNARTPIGTSQTIQASHVDGKAWKFYHKRGGLRRWSGSAEHAIKWDADSKAAYTFPKHMKTDGVEHRAGIAISGISSELCARVATPGALWESNKVFVFFPKADSTYTTEFFLALLNSSTYRRIASALNHTVSMQVRDIKALPLLPFTEAEVTELSNLARVAVTASAGSDTVTLEAAEKRIDALVEGALTRQIRGHKER